jgi:ABC-type amino acid transport substrate-binding protein
LKIRKYKVLPIIVIISLFAGQFGSGCSSSYEVSESEPSIKNTAISGAEVEIIKVGINTNNSPWTYMQNDTLKGFEVDILNEIEKVMGVKFAYFPATDATVLAGLNQKKWDVAVSSLLEDGSYDNGISFTEPYYISRLAIMVKEDSQINDFELMKDGKFGAATGSDALSWLKAHIEQYGAYEIMEYNSATLAIEDLVNLNLSGVVADSSTLFYYAARNPGVRITAEMEVSTPMAFAYRKGDLLGGRFDSAIQMLIANGTLPAIQEKWFGASLVEANPLNLVYQESFGYPETYLPPEVIRVGIQTDNPPWEMIVGEEMVGFEVEILSEATNRLGVNVEFIPANPNSIFSGLLADQWDISASAIEIKRDRMADVDFTGPYFDHSLALLTLNDSSVTEVANLTGGRYGVLDGSKAETWLRNHIEEFGPYVVDEYSNLDTAITDLQDEAISGVVSDAYILLNRAVESDHVEVPLLFEKKHFYSICYSTIRLFV